MLVEFRVKNFRSLRDEQILSLVAAKDKSLEDTHTFTTGINAVPTLLRSAVIYGANASGKSNLIKALQYMRGVVLESASVIQPGQTYSVQPFRLDAKSAQQPTEFEITFLLDGIRYQYGFTMTTQRIMSEYLLVYKAFKPQCWFKRQYDPETDKDIYEFGAGLKGSKNTWETATRPNSLFLSMAVQLNSEPLRPIFDWFVNQLLIFNEQAKLNPQISIQQLQQADNSKIFCDALTAADMSISNIEVISRKVPRQAVHVDFTDGKTEIRNEEMEEYQLRFRHVTAEGEATFDLMDESSGTRNLLFLIGPIRDVLKKGITLIIDELDTSLHTLLVRDLVKQFYHPNLNTNGAQIIFTTHDTSLLDAYGLFRRDQIWLVEKDRQQASKLVALSEFSPRKNEALERGYLQGRYGGVPFLKQLGLKC
ncbi:MAG: AAA family ATPase [Gammaproteobacteria bacterium]